MADKNKGAINLVVKNMITITGFGEIKKHSADINKDIRSLDPRDIPLVIMPPMMFNQYANPIIGNKEMPPMMHYSSKLVADGRVNIIYKNKLINNLYKDFFYVIRNKVSNKLNVYMYHDQDKFTTSDMTTARRLVGMAMRGAIILSNSSGDKNSTIMNNPKLMMVMIKLIVSMVRNTINRSNSGITKNPVFKATFEMLIGKYVLNQMYISSGRHMSEDEEKHLLMNMFDSLGYSNNRSITFSSIQYTLESIDLAFTKSHNIKSYHDYDKSSTWSSTTSKQFSIYYTKFIDFFNFISNSPELAKTSDSLAIMDVLSSNPNIDNLIKKLVSEFGYNATIGIEDPMYFMLFMNDILFTTRLLMDTRIFDSLFVSNSDNNMLMKLLSNPGNVTMVERIINSTTNGLTKSDERLLTGDFVNITLAENNDTNFMTNDDYRTIEDSFSNYEV